MPLFLRLFVDFTENVERLIPFLLIDFPFIQISRNNGYDVADDDRGWNHLAVVYWDPIRLLRLILCRLHCNAFTRIRWQAIRQLHWTLAIGHCVHDSARSPHFFSVFGMCMSVRSPAFCQLHIRSQCGSNSFTWKCASAFCRRKKKCQLCYLGSESEKCSMPAERRCCGRRGWSHENQLQTLRCLCMGFECDTIQFHAIILHKFFGNTVFRVWCSSTGAKHAYNDGNDADTNNIGHHCHSCHRYWTTLHRFFSIKVDRNSIWLSFSHWLLFCKQIE